MEDIKSRYKRAVEDLENRTTGKDDITIESVSKALEELGNPEEDCEIVLVGGTNGKGSTVEMISELLQSLGKNIGSFKSPHLTSVRERIRMDGRKIPEEDFLELYREIDDLEQELSFFEFTTVMAYLYFSREEADYAVMEVGMGGRLDATNAADPTLSVITNIDLDHTKYLGESRQEIAEEKAGIIPENGKLVTAEQRNAIQRTAEERSSEIIIPRKVEKRGEKFIFQSQDFPLPVNGSFQKQNLENSLTAVRELEEIPENLGEALSGLKCPGRMEKISEEPEIILDGAHNPAAVESIIEDLPEQFVCVFNTIETKKIEEMLELLEPKTSKFIFTESEIEWSREPETISEKTAEDSEVIRDPKKAVEEAARTGLPVVVTGSLYLIGEIKDTDLSLKPKIEAEER